MIYIIKKIDKIIIKILVNNYFIMDTEVIEDSEMYVWLGKMLNTHFFIHTVSSEQWSENISLGLYNCLIHNKFITSPEENIIIFTINKINGQIKCIVVSHETIAEKIRVDSDNLENIFPILFKHERSNLIAIQYYYDNPRYSYYELADNIVMWKTILKNIPTEKIDICEIVYGVSNKPLINII